MFGFFCRCCMSRFIITTAVKATATQMKQAEQFAKQWQVPYITRQKATLEQLRQKYGSLFIVYANRYEYLHHDGVRLFFHPSTAVVRIKNGYDPLVELVGTKKTVLDCTMGLANDSLVMAYYNNDVIALEKDNIIYTIVSNGLKQFDDVSTDIKQAMSSITCIHSDYEVYLSQALDNSVDIVYFDPMFSHTIQESTTINGIKTRQNREILTANVLSHAKRVAREKVIIKAHYRDDVFERFGFERLVRVNTKFHYGQLLVSKK